MDLDMGKYVVFVWGCYSATLVGIGGLVGLSLRAHAQRKKVLEALQAAAEDARK